MSTIKENKMKHGIIRINKNSIVYNVDLENTQIHQQFDLTNSKNDIKVPLKVRIMAWLFIKICGNCLYSHSEGQGIHFNTKET
jgi:hypothetical protein